MSLTRKYLSALGIDAEKIDEIMSAHMGVVNEIKEERDKFKSDSETLEKVNKELADLKESIADKDFEGKLSKQKESYEKLKSEFDSYKSDVEKKAKKQAIENSYRKLLKDSGISEKRLDSIMRVSTLDDVELGEDGQIKDADKLSEKIKTEWADFIATERQEGAATVTPPGRTEDPAKKTGRAAQMVAQYRNEHYGNPIKEG